MINNIVNICGQMIRDNDIGEAFSMYMEDKLHCGNCDVYNNIYSIQEETEINQLSGWAWTFVNNYHHDRNPYLDGCEVDELDEAEKQELDTYNKICEACEYYGKKLEEVEEA